VTPFERRARSHEALVPTVLFLCSGNYYRSRFAEALFNHRAAAQRLGWAATSAGLMPEKFALNPGAVSPIVIEALSARHIVLRDPRRPVAVREADFAVAARVVALKEAEHRPLIAASFPAWTDRVVYWNVHDTDCGAPADTIRDIDARVDALIGSLPRRGEARRGQDG